jgi:small multidrug resistance pump
VEGWLILLAAIVLEVAGTTCMKLADGFSRPLPAALMFAFYAASFVSLTMAVKRIDLGVAYAVWAGLGTALIATIGMLYFREAVTATRLASIGLIIVGVVGLNLGEVR